MPSDFLSPHNLFDLDQTIARAVFAGTAYAWEALPLISGFIRELAGALPSDYRQIADGVWVGSGTFIETTAMIKGPAIIGRDCEIRHGAFLRGDCIIGDEAVVGNSTEVKNSILFNRVQVPHFNYVGDSILGHRAHLGAGVICSNVKANRGAITVKARDGALYETGLLKFGAMVGDGAEVGCNAVLNPGTVLGRDSVVYPLTPVRGVVPSGHIVKGDGSIVRRREHQG